LKPVSMGELAETFKKIEEFIAKTIKNLLVVVDSETRRREIIDLISGNNVEATVAPTLAQAYQYLQFAQFDCIVIDVHVEQGVGVELLEQLHREERLSHIPVVLYADRELTAHEEEIVQRCTDSLTIKSVRTPERLLDETTLFLHQISTKLTSEKRNMLRMVHDKEAILVGKRVLIVDDDIRNTFALATVLEDKEMEIIVAKNGKEALALLEQQPIADIILMDIMMPEMDGYEAMRQIRAQPRFRKLPIIALTAKAMKGDKAKCIEAGANDYLAKPVNTDKLLSLMRVWLYR
ncbi:MAG: histidine kinase, partial [Beggiatoa sp. IS2]